MILSDLLKNSVSKYGECSFLYHRDESYTNVECESIATRISCLIDELGIQAGDRILVCMQNSPEVIFVYQGILRSGAIIVPVMDMLHENEISFILENSKAKSVFTSSLILDKIIKSANGLVNKPKVICVNSPDDQNENSDIGFIDLNKRIKDVDVTKERKPQIKESDIAVILYTSGTTGEPKGVMLTHKNLYSNAYNGTSLTKDKERTTTIGVLPLAHIYGFNIMNSLLIQGDSVVILSEFDAEKVFKVIDKFKVKSFSAVPAMIHAMVADSSADKYDLSSLEKVGSGSAALPISLRRRFQEKFGADVRDAYGLSEASPGVATQREDMPIKDGSVGVAFPGVTIKVVDEHNMELPAGETGELLVKGDNVTPGYFQNEEETKKALQDGWLHTGDMAKIDEDGYLFIVGRKKELIIRGGFNIYPRELEELIARHDTVSEVAVIGIPSNKMGEEILACVVKQANSQITEQELIEYTQSYLAKYKTPRKVVFLDTLPRNAVGKIAKRELKDMYQDLPLSNI